MESIGSFFRNYEFLQLTSSIWQRQTDLFQQPNDTWKQVGEKALRVAGNQFLSSTVYPFADAMIYGIVSMGRSCGKWLPPLAIPDLPRPQDNVELLDYSAKRALSRWSDEKRAIIESEFDDQLGDEYDIFSVLGEWAIAVYCENIEDPNFFIPTFLEYSKALADRTTVTSLGDRFKKLSDADKREILLSIYENKKDAPLTQRLLSTEGERVYRDLRALAALMPGNKIFQEAVFNYFERRPALAAAAPAPISRPVPSAPPVIQPVTDLTADVGTFRDFIGGLSERLRLQVLHAIRNDHDLPEESEPLFLFTRLLILLRSNNNPNCKGYPPSFPWNERLGDGSTCRQAVSRLNPIGYDDRARLLTAILDPNQFNNLGDRLQKVFFTVSEIAEKCRSLQQFREAYCAYRTSLARV